MSISPPKNRNFQVWSQYQVKRAVEPVLCYTYSRFSDLCWYHNTVQNLSLFSALMKNNFMLGEA